MKTLEKLGVFNKTLSKEEMTSLRGGSMNSYRVGTDLVTVFDYESGGSHYTSTYIHDSAGRLVYSETADGPGWY